MKQMRGIFTIPETPFLENYEVDYDSFRKEIEFCLECGAHGIVFPVNASESQCLSAEERSRLMSECVRIVNGKVPIVVGCTDKTVKDSIAAVRWACNSGADAVLSMPPFIEKPQNDEDIYEFFGKLNEASTVPIFIQNHQPPFGTELSVDLQCRIYRDFDLVKYVKEETPLSPISMTRIAEETKDLPAGSFMGYMGGQGAYFFFEEYMRGSCGNMPACHLTDVMVDMWDLLEEGKHELAYFLYKELLPLITYDRKYMLTFFKEVLRRRGIFKTAVIRPRPAGDTFRWPELDAQCMKELDYMLARVAPYYRVK